MIVENLGLGSDSPNGSGHERGAIASVPFSELFVWPCGDRSEVTDEGPDCATSLFS